MRKLSRRALLSKEPCSENDRWVMTDAEKRYYYEGVLDSITGAGVMGYVMSQHQVRHPPIYGSRRARPANPRPAAMASRSGYSLPVG